MSRANKIGLAALMLTALSAIVSSLWILCWVGIILLIYSGIKGSRWWFAPPTAIIVVWIWVLSQGH